MLLCNVVDKLHDKDRLANSRTAKQTYLTALCIGSDKVNYLDTRLEYLGGALLLGVGGRISVYAPALLRLGLGSVVDRLAQQIEYSAKGSLAYGNGNAFAGVDSGHSARHTVGAGHCDTSDHVVTDLACNLTHQLAALVLYLNCVEKVGQATVFKSNIKNRSDYLYYFSDILTHFRSFL